MSNNTQNPSTSLIPTDKQKACRDAQDTYDRYHSQSLALLLALSGNDQFATMREDDVACALWLLLDRFNDLGRAYKELVDIVEGN